MSNLLFKLNYMRPIHRREKTIVGIGTHDAVIQWVHKLKNAHLYGKSYTYNRWTNRCVKLYEATGNLHVNIQKNIAFNLTLSFLQWTDIKKDIEMNTRKSNSSYTYMCVLAQQKVHTAGSKHTAAGWLI